MYEKQNFTDGAFLFAKQLNTIEDGIVDLESKEIGNLICWHQCPQIVREYLKNTTYNPKDYNISNITDFAPAIPEKANSKPIGKKVNGITFYNNIPKYGDEIDNYIIMPLDHVRYINCPKAFNVRDLGGWYCDGGTIKYGLLIRGSELEPEDRAVLVDECGITCDLDLRGNDVTITSSPLGEDITYIRADSYNWYHAQNTEAWKTNIKCIFDNINNNKPVYFHCAAGADRTGTLACILEGLLGMTQSDIDKDYELTSFFSGTETVGRTRARNESEWKGLIQSINSYKGNSFRDKCVYFIRSLGFSIDEINNFRLHMIQGNPKMLLDTYETITLHENVLSVQENNLNKRISGLQNIVSYNGVFISEPIGIDLGQNITMTFHNFMPKLKGTIDNLADIWGQSKILLLDKDKNCLANWFLSGTRFSTDFYWEVQYNDTDFNGNVTSLLEYSACQAGTVPTAADVAYVQFSIQISKDAITLSDLEGLEIYID